MLSQPPLFKSVGALAGMRAKAPGMAPVRPPAISRSAGLSAPGGALRQGGEPGELHAAHGAHAPDPRSPGRCGAPHPRR